MSFENAAKLLSEFDYKKNGKETTIEFLIYMLNELVNGGENE